MLIILEGVDGSGKTTVAKKLEKVLGFKVLPTIPLQSRHNDVWEFYLKDRENVYIVDRSFITDVVYRTVDDKNINFDPVEISIWLQSAKALVIHCNTDTSFTDSIKRGEDNITDSAVHFDLKQAYKYYMLYIDRYTNTEVIKFNWRKDKFKNLVKDIKSSRLMRIAESLKGTTV